MVGVYTQLKLLFIYCFEKSYLYNFIIRFKFGLNHRPAGLKERYKFFPWKVVFKRWWFYFPANTKKIYWCWFTVKHFYSPPTKKFIAPSLIIQKYFPEYDILQDEVITKAWKAVNAHYYIRWQRELYWYKLRARFAQEKSWGVLGTGLFPHYWWDESSSRRPLKYKYIPSWDLVKLLAALDLLWWKMPTEIKWKKRLKLRLHRNKRFNKRLDLIGWFLHLFFWSPWKFAFEFFWKYGITYWAIFNTKTIDFIVYWRRTWRDNDFHRKDGLFYWAIRSLIIFFVFTIPSLALTQLIASLQYLVCMGNPLLWEFAGYNSQNWIKYNTPEHRTTLGVMTDEPIGLAITFNIVIFVLNIIMCFSPKFWAWLHGFGLYVGRCFAMSYYYLCPLFIGTMLDIDWIYDVMPISSCYFFVTFWTKWWEDAAYYFDPEQDKPLLRYDESLVGTGKGAPQSEMVIPFLTALYKNPDWKDTGGNIAQLLMRRSVKEGERHLATHMKIFRENSWNFRTAFWRKRHRYLIFFAEQWIERNNLEEKDPKKFLINWVRGLYAFWDTEMNNASNLFEWEHYGRHPELKQRSTFTEARKKYLYDNYLNFWVFFVENVTRRVGKKRDVVEYSERFAHILSTVDGEELGTSEILTELHGNKDQDVLHTLYYDSFKLQQAVWNEDLITTWEEGRLIHSTIWTKDKIMQDFIRRGFDESKGGTTYDPLNRHYDFYEFHEEIYDEWLIADRKSPIYGAPKDALIHPGMLIFKVEVMDFAKLHSQGKTESDDGLGRFKYDRRWPITQAVHFYAKSTDWAAISQKAFYGYFKRRFIILQNLVTIGIMEACILICVLDKKRNYVRPNVMKELFMIKYVNFVYPTSLLYVFHFMKTMDYDKFITDFFKDYEQFQNLIILTSDQYLGSEYNNQPLIKRDFKKSVDTLDVIFDSAMDDCDLKSYWNDFKNKDKAYKDLMKEKVYTEEIYEDLVRVEFENYYLKVNLKKKLISKSFYGKMVRVFAMKMAIAIDKKKNLEWIKRLNEEHFFFTKHYHIIISLHKPFLGRYEFPKVTVINKSGYLDALYKQNPLRVFINYILVGPSRILKFIVNLFSVERYKAAWKAAWKDLKLDREVKRKQRDALFKKDLAEAQKNYEKDLRTQRLRVDLKDYKHLDKKTAKRLRRRRWLWFKEK